MAKFYFSESGAVDSLFIENNDTDTIFPREILKFKSLKNLRFTGTYCDLGPDSCFNILNLPYQIQDLANLETLALNTHGLLSLPSSLGNMKSVKRLSLSGNRVKNIEVILEMENLEELYLFYSYFDSSKLNFGMLKQLKQLKVIGISPDSRHERLITEIRHGMPHVKIETNQ
jgi:Leucine-rich repeat (LRR) protein